MSSAIASIIAKKALKDVAKKNINSKDPYFEEVPIYGRDGRPTGQVKKQKKGLPPGLTQNDGQVLKKVRRRAYRLDMSLFSFFGTRFGWSSVIGIIPVIGDFIDMFMAYMVVQSCKKVDGGLPAAIVSRMYFNVVLDFAVGLVPFVGDLADAIFRANTRNAWILEEYLTKKAQDESKLAAGQPIEDENGKPVLPARPGAAGESGGFGGLGGLLGRRSQRADEEMAMTAVSAGGNNNGHHQQQSRR